MKDMILANIGTKGEVDQEKTNEEEETKALGSA